MHDVGIELADRSTHCRNKHGIEFAPFGASDDLHWRAVELVGARIVRRQRVNGHGVPARGKLAAEGNHLGFRPAVNQSVDDEKDSHSLRPALPPHLKGQQRPDTIRRISSLARNARTAFATESGFRMFCRLISAGLR